MSAFEKESSVVVLAKKAIAADTYFALERVVACVDTGKNKEEDALRATVFVNQIIEQTSTIDRRVEILRDVAKVSVHNRAMKREAVIGILADATKLSRVNECLGAVIFAAHEAKANGFEALEEAAAIKFSDVVSKDPTAPKTKRCLRLICDWQYDQVPLYLAALSFMSESEKTAYAERDAKYSRASAAREIQSMIAAAYKPQAFGGPK